MTPVVPPTKAPLAAGSPTESPKAPTVSPSVLQPPTVPPIASPTQSPLLSPSVPPSVPQTKAPDSPTLPPTVPPTAAPSLSPLLPTRSPTQQPVQPPTASPTAQPSDFRLPADGEFALLTLRVWLPLLGHSGLWTAESTRQWAVVFAKELEERFGALARLHVIQVCALGEYRKVQPQLDSCQPFSIRYDFWDKSLEQRRGAQLSEEVIVAEVDVTARTKYTNITFEDQMLRDITVLQNAYKANLSTGVRIYGELVPTETLTEEEEAPSFPLVVAIAVGFIVPLVVAAAWVFISKNKQPPVKLGSAQSDQLSRMDPVAPNFKPLRDRPTSIL
eukprot:Hpha_TRINITY_DN2928_c0_g1::TRINITY_DN2928_c0_g1_i1::g.19608::m.19608